MQIAPSCILGQIAVRCCSRNFLVVSRHCLLNISPEAFGARFNQRLQHLIFWSTFQPEPNLQHLTFGVCFNQCIGQRGVFLYTCLGINDLDIYYTSIPHIRILHVND